MICAPQIGAFVRVSEADLPILGTNPAVNALSIMKNSGLLGK
jgi:hypothetical protein